MKRIGFFLVLAASALLAASAQAQQLQSASANDTARFLAGMELPSDSPLVPLAQEPGIRQHAAYFESAFGGVEEKQLAKVRAWSAANLTAPKPVMFYMFGGPDFLYANAFFPHATTYVLSGLEPVGPIPDVLRLPRGAAAQALRNIQGSLRSILRLSYFITAHMNQDLNAGPLNGTLPILYVFLARSGKTIHDVSLVHLDDQGVLQEGDGIRQRSPARGVKIVFSEKAGPRRTLYYFSTNLADQRGRTIALLQFCKSLGPGDSFLKSASYLLHSSEFSQVRTFILENSSLILQDDTGVPVRFFDAARWQLRPFGRYVGPIPMFEGMYQSRLNDLFQRGRPMPIDFGLGYRWYANESNLLLASREPLEPTTASIAKEAPAATAPPVERQVPAETGRQAYRPPPSRPGDDYDRYDPYQQRAYRPPPPARPREAYRDPYSYERAYPGQPPPLPLFPFFPFLLMQPQPPPPP